MTYKKKHKKIVYIYTFSMARPTDEGQRYNTQQGSEWWYNYKEGRGRHINPFLDYRLQ